MRVSGFTHFTSVAVVALAVCGFTAGCMEFSYADDTYVCAPGTANACPPGFACLPSPTSNDNRCLRSANPCGDGVCSLDETPTTCPADCFVECGNGTCEGGETSRICPADCPEECGNNLCEPIESESQSCPADCSQTCGPDLPGTNYDFIISQVAIPQTTGEADIMGVDINDDGVIDNVLGRFVANLTAYGVNLNNEVQEAVLDGVYITAGRLRLDSLPNDDVMFAKLVPAECDGGPVFDGSDNLSVNWATYMDQRFCGQLNAGRITTEPSDYQVELPYFYFDGTGILVNLKRARMDGAVSSTGWTEMMIGGGLDENEVDNVLIPGIAASLNRQIQADCQSTCGSLTQALMSQLDAQCDDTLPGCENTSSDPACAPHDPVDDPFLVITPTEIRCNAVFRSLLAPEIDSNDDGVPDLLSVGWVMHAVSATIN